MLLWLPLVLGLAVPPPALPPQDHPALFEQTIAASLESVYMLGIARRGTSGPEVFQFVGTGWVIAEGKLATNAHVVEALLEGSFDGRLVAKRSWSDRDELSLSPASVRIHPAYGPWNARLKRVVVRNDADPNAARSLSFIPIADVATIEVEAGNTAKPLTLADPKQVEPVLSEAVVYLGFPHENLSGFPTLHAVPGHITAKTDFFFQRTGWADSYLIHYCGPVVGGASGSPMLNRAGQVIGLLSATEHNLSADGGRTSFGFAYGQRSDLVRELLSEDYEAVQALRDKTWSARLTDLLIPPDELLEQLAQQQAQREGVAQLNAGNTVMRRQGTVKQDEPARLQVVIEPGLRYGFLAAAHDGSDIDAHVSVRGTEDVLAVDFQSDYFPILWVGPLEARTAVTFEVAAAERLLADTTCSMHIYKYEPQLIDTGDSATNEALFFETRYTTPDEVGGVATWTFQVEAGAQMMFTGESSDGYDIDLQLALDGEIVASDETGDAIPLIIFGAEAGGTLELRLRVPGGTPAGAGMVLRGMLIDGAAPLLLGGATGAASGPIENDELHVLLEDLMQRVWENTGSEGEAVTEDYTSVDGELVLTFDVPAGAVPVFLALAPQGEDIDMDLSVDGELVAQDNAVDPAPLLAIPATDAARKVTLRIYESLPDAAVQQVGYRFSLVR